MNKREKMLATAVLLLGALWATNHYYGRYSKALHDRQTELLTARSNLADAKLKLSQGQAARQHVDALQQRSLPANYEKALSLYKAWLLAKAKDAGLAVIDIKLAPTTSNSAAYKAVGYQVLANGSLSSVVGMLYEFYRSPQLHQITRLQLTR